jgi:hypothetical protein
MGQPVTVVETRSNIEGLVRFETNRWLTGMGHERYTADTRITKDRPADRIARCLFETGKVAEVHVYGQSVTVKVRPHQDATGLREVLQDLYTYYRPGVEVPNPDTFGAPAE